MKIKFLTVLSIAAFLLLSGCRSTETNTNVNVNANKTNTNMAATTPAPSMDAAAKTAVEDALKKKGFNDVTVEATTTEITLRGSVPKGKLGEAVQAATEAGKRKINNQLTEK